MWDRLLDWLTTTDVPNNKKKPIFEVVTSISTMIIVFNGMYMNESIIRKAHILEISQNELFESYLHEYSQLLYPKIICSKFSSQLLSNHFPWKKRASFSSFTRYWTISSQRVPLKLVQHTICLVANNVPIDDESLQLPHATSGSTRPVVHLKAEVAT